MSVRGGEVVVRDHGPGIDEARTSPTSSTASTVPPRRAASPGSGLGLAIVRQVAESHGGEVTAERADGGGTLVRLPPLGS